MDNEAHLLFFVLLLFFASAEASNNVTYDRRSLIIDGQRKLLISASIHYPRSVPAMWPGLVAAAKEGGADTIETYVFWNGHELSAGNYYFEDRFDLVKFAKIVRDAGLYMILRIGPFVAAEWNFGGVPVWLHYVPGTVFRTDNEPFKSHMKSFTTYIVEMMKREKLFASQGGHIILAQIENEYGDIETVYGAGGKQYAMWAANMALSQNIGVPWIMCQQYDAPDHVINTCNSFYCDRFTPNADNKPKIWTENWPGWFQTFGATNPHRPPEDIAFAVARFFQKGGSVQNYYVYHGGTNFGRTTGGPFITTSYDYDAPIDEYGIVRLPKWAHLRDLHKAIKLCEHTLLHGESKLLPLGPLQEADVYEDPSGGCISFLANVDEHEDKLITFRNATYHVPAWSVSILPDCKTVAFNTAKVRSQSAIVEMVPENLQASSTLSITVSGTWQVFVEKIGVWGKPEIINNQLVDHLNTTQDTTDYLWYTTSFHIDNGEEILRNGSHPVLMVESKGHAVLAFVNGELQGNAYGNGGNLTFELQAPVTLKSGKNDIAFLSMTVGLQNAGPFYEWVGAGLTSVKISGIGNGSLDLSHAQWVYKIGLEGEHHNIYKADSKDDLKWISKVEPPKNQSLTWYKVAVDPPEGNEPVALDMQSMGKGQVWLNGKAIGRYWPIKSSIYDNCTPNCNYRGKFNPDKCRTGCGQPTQRWYHVPKSWFQPSGNTLVIFEEQGGDPTKITFARRRVTSICGFVSEHYPHIDLENWDSTIQHDARGRAAMHLNCPEGTSISSITFASFGNPSGTCKQYLQGSCHYPNSISVVEKSCLRNSSCAISFSDDNFGKDLCPGITKTLAVEAACS
ncbi:beta-galactosidase 3 isoform X1 [Canna indica]|uniref:beta-galactosidase n=1 Tax=Canna indica TaxID=4628 RepID=A0AAQ3JYH2_9LILI|nr:beta-galactosidase 3 isoform X1 [Canna indica]